MTTRRDFIKSAGVGAVAMVLSSKNLMLAKPKKKTPNILFIMSDDHTSQAIGSYGSYLKEVCPTKNIDRIADEGMLLENCFCTNSICTPSRANILSGQYSHVNGVYTLKDDFQKDHKMNVAIELQKNGYETAVVGKWHLHTEPQGFDYYNVLPGQGKYHNPEMKEIGHWIKAKNKGTKKYEGHSSDVITDQALNWLDNRDKKDENPFFLMCHFKAPHGLWEYNEKYEHIYDGVDIPEPPSLFDNKSDRSEGSRIYGTTLSTKNEYRSRVRRMEEDWWPTGTMNTEGMTEKEKTKAAYQKYIRDYLRTVAGVDDNVGRLLDYLDKNNLTDNTVVIYTADQGMFLGEHDRVDKRWIYEESLRMPFLIRYPKEIKANSVNDDIVNNVDFAPTFLEFAGAKIPSEMQGHSMKSLLAGKTPVDWKTATYYRYWMHRAHHDVPAHYGIRTKRYKLIFFYGLLLDESVKNRKKREEKSATGKALSVARGWGKLMADTPASFELYDLAKDPDELNNVYGKAKYADVAKELKAELLKIKKQIGDTDDKYPKLLKKRNKIWNTYTKN